MAYFFKELVIDENIYIIWFADLQYFGPLGTDPQSNFPSTILQVVCHMLHGFSLSSKQWNIICKVQISEVLISSLDTEVFRVHGLLHHIASDHNEQEW